ncbi:MAG: phosphomannomutase/phosphoglucomutase [Lysobacterales bacterium]
MLKMRKPKTALEAAMRGKTVGINVERAAMSAGFTVLVGTAVLCVYQALMVFAEDRAEAALFELRDQTVVKINTWVGQQQAGLTAALADPDLVSALASPDPETRKGARAVLVRHLPLLNEAEFFAPDLLVLLDSDLGGFGYAKAGILAEARQVRGNARAQMHRCVNTEGDCLALAQPVREGESELAFAYVLLPIQGLYAELGDAAPGGVLSLLQGSTTGSDRALLRVGDASADDSSANVERKPIAQSHFMVSAQRSTLFKPGLIFPVLDSRNVFGLFGIALLSTLAALALVYKRLFPKGLMRKPVAEPEEQLMPALAASKSTRTVVVDKGAGTGIEVSEGAPAPAMATAIDRSIFRAYDIRGVVGKTLTPAVAMLIGQALGTMARERGLNQLCVGRDGRKSGPKLAEALIAGLRAAGCDVIDLGMVPTPVLYFATHELNTGSGVMVTGSHNPPDYNGFKIMLGGETLAEESIQEIFARIVEGNLAHGLGGQQRVDLLDQYYERIISDVQTERRLKVVVDCGNGVAGVIAERLLEGIGCEVNPLFCEVDGEFPNHHPDPSDPANLTDLQFAVKQLNADIGIAFDGDGDRLGVVTPDGTVIYPDRLLMLFAEDVLTRNPGAAVIYDVKCTGQLSEAIVRAGGSPIMWKTGHSLIKAKMREENAALAGEMSGHFFFAERWYGFDDALYAAARLLEILALRDESPQQVFAELPNPISTPELKIVMTEGEHYQFIERFRERARFPGARITGIDGVRADYKDGWGLVRCSNTTPCLVLRFEGASPEAIARIQQEFREQLLAIDANLKLPF